MNKIKVLLLDGASDHYIVPVAMNSPELERDGERYVRTQEVRKVDVKGRGIESYRVYVCDEERV